MSDIAYLITGAVGGAIAAGAAAWFAARASTAAAQARAEAAMEQAVKLEGEAANLRKQLDLAHREQADSAARLEEARKALDEQRKLIEGMELKLAETFKALSLDALAKNSEQFMKIADKTLKAQSELGVKDLDTKKQLIEKNLDEMGKRMMEIQRRFEEQSQGNLKQIGEVVLGIKHHEEATKKLHETTDQLRHTLASTKKRGEWGERMAEDVIRLAGMIEGVNYIKQRATEHSTGRPDYSFKLPNNLVVNMDVKFPMDHYMHYINAETDEARTRHRKELVAGVRGMIKDVTGSREYIGPNTVDYVIIFIPNEQVYAFINESDPLVMDESLAKKVILCSPFTLYAVLAVIRQAVENFNLERTASEILKLLSTFNKQWEMYVKSFKLLGQRIDAVQKEYEVLDGTRTNMLERPLRKIEELRQQKSITLDEDTASSLE